MKSVVSLLKEKKLKLTPQRLAIFHMLYTTDTHPNAESIYKSLAETHPSMSLATVYKTLDSLKKAGLVQELNLGEDSFRYDANCDCHMHFKCQECGNIYDLPYYDTLDGLKSEIEKESNFEVKTQQLYFFGTCDECKSN